MAKTCPNCGVAVKSDDVFCPFCGTTITAEQASSSYSFEESKPTDQFDSSTPSSEESYSYGSGGYILNQLIALESGINLLKGSVLLNILLSGFSICVGVFT
ncbi:MAG: zinc-ribbon domain-containing protein [Candidatus Heimdallarchaeota archaeon]|nr:zinc-ribbon domain-containing protein [Candidatus Heimdallarchaeota archaeon]